MPLRWKNKNQASTNLILLNIQNSCSHSIISIGPLKSPQHTKPYYKFNYYFTQITKYQFRPPNPAISFAITFFLHTYTTAYSASSTYLYTKMVSAYTNKVKRPPKISTLANLKFGGVGSFLILFGLLRLIAFSVRVRWAMKALPIPLSFACQTKCQHGEEILAACRSWGC